MSMVEQRAAISMSLNRTTEKHNAAMFSRNTNSSNLTLDDIHKTLDAFGIGESNMPMPKSKALNGKHTNAEDLDSFEKTAKALGCQEVVDFFKRTDFTYSEEWNELFHRADYLRRLKVCCLLGYLRTTRFRSLCWKLYLEVLPETQSKWLTQTKEWRSHYETLKNRIVVKPQKMTSLDLSINNPLCPDDENPWNQYFKNKSAREQIKRDINRIHFLEPGEEGIQSFFDRPFVRRLLKNILFCYSTEHEDIGYYQGMNDLLLPIVWSLHSDQQSMLAAVDNNLVSDVMQELLDPTYIEHDAYAIFTQLMKTAGTWCRFDESLAKLIPNDCLNSVAEQKKVKSLTPSLLTSKLWYINDKLLQYFSYNLYSHLLSVSVWPPTYGFRWVLVMFSRELRRFEDVLYLWDAIFADSSQLDLVDYIFIAILIRMQDQLLAGDCTECLVLLTGMLDIIDVQLLIEHARKLRYEYANPALVDYQLVYHNDVILSDKADAVDGSEKVSAIAPSRDSHLPKSKSGPASEVYVEPVQVKKTATTSKKQNEAEAMVERLKSKVSKLEETCELCACDMDVSIAKLQKQLAGKKVSRDDIKDAIYGLKQVSFTLKDAISNTGSFSSYSIVEMQDVKTFTNLIQSPIPDQTKPELYVSGIHQTPDAANPAPVLPRHGTGGATECLSEELGGQFKAFSAVPSTLETVDEETIPRGNGEEFQSDVSGSEVLAVPVFEMESSSTSIPLMQIPHLKISPSPVERDMTDQVTSE